jgi:hypothetical protein
MNTEACQLVEVGPIGDARGVVVRAKTNLACFSQYFDDTIATDPFIERSQICGMLMLSCNVTMY